MVDWKQSIEALLPWEPAKKRTLKPEPSYQINISGIPKWMYRLLLVNKNATFDWSPIKKFRGNWQKAFVFLSAFVSPSARSCATHSYYIYHYIILLESVYIYQIGRSVRLMVHVRQRLKIIIFSSILFYFFSVYLCRKKHLLSKILVTYATF